MSMLGAPHAKRLLAHLTCFSFGHKPDWLGRRCLRCGGRYHRYGGWSDG